MRMKTKCLLLGFSLLLLAFAACMETDKANKLIEAGNALITEGNTLVQEAGAKNDKVFDTLSTATPKTSDDEEEGGSGPAAVDTKAVNSTAQEAISGFEKSAVKYREAAAKFDEASKLKIHEKLKEYLVLKTQEFNKRAELSEAAKSNCKAVLDGGDKATMLKQIASNQERITKLNTEASDLAAKADKIQQENKSIFKPDSK